MAEDYLVFDGQTYKLEKRKRLRQGEQQHHVVIGGETYVWLKAARADALLRAKQLDELPTDSLTSEEITEAIVRELLLSSVRAVRGKPTITWNEIEYVEIGIDTQSSPYSRMEYVFLLEEVFNRQLATTGLRTKQLERGFLWRWITAYPSTTYGALVGVIHLSVSPVS